MRAVNLIPAGAGQGAARSSFGRLGAGHVVLAVLAIALAFVTIYVLSSNTVSDRRAKLATIQAEVTQAQAQAGQLSAYAAYAGVAKQRTDTVLQIANSRFDWHGAMADLSRVIPPNLRLQTLLATVAPGVTVSGAGGSAGAGQLNTAGLRADIAAPAFEMRGCTTSHDAVARLMSRLRLINGVQRVTLADSSRAPQAEVHLRVHAAGSATGASTATTVPQIVGCGANPDSFDIVVFFTPLPGALPVTGSTPSTASTTTSTTSTTSTTTSTATPVSSSGSAAPFNGASTSAQRVSSSGSTP